MNYEVVFIINSERTYDSYSYKDIIANFFIALNIEINVVSFSCLTEIFKVSFNYYYDKHKNIISSIKKTAYLTNGLAFEAKNVNDLNSFFNYICYKKFRPTKQFLSKSKITFSIVDNKENDSVCNCHNYFT